MQESHPQTSNNRYLDPYLGGLLLGLVLLAAFAVGGRGLGVSGALGVCAAKAFGKGALSHEWIVWQVLGLLAGGFLSGLLAHRVRLTIERVPSLSRWKRLLFAFSGGILFGFGSQLGRGCTSGAALSGMAVLSAAGFVTMFAIFGTAFALAYFFRRIWR